MWNSKILKNQIDDNKLIVEGLDEYNIGDIHIHNAVEGASSKSLCIYHMGNVIDGKALNKLCKAPLYSRRIQTCSRSTCC